MKIILYGKDDVGKSATLVRLVTGRFISEYSHEQDITKSYVMPRIDNQAVVLIKKITKTVDLSRPE